MQRISGNIHVRKILFYINLIDSGGAERAITTLANKATENELQVVFVTSLKCPVEYELSPKIKRLILESSEKKGRIRKNWVRIKKLREIIASEKPDVAISFMAEPNYRLLIAASGLSVKTIISIRNDPNREYSGRIGRFLARHLFVKADGCVFQTPDAKAWFPAKIQNRSAIIHNAVNDRFYKTAWSGDGDYIVSIGRLTEQKNHCLLIDAFELVSQNDPNLKLRIYGQGDMEHEISRYIDNLGLTDKVFLMGQTDTPEEALKHARCFVLSSDYEGMPNALMEALAVGVPSVSTDCPCGGPQSLIDNGINGLLVPVGNSNELAKSITEILDNHKLSKSISEKAREKAMMDTSDNIYNQWITYINHICEV